MSYRFSQDALEMFFSKIRGCFGWNNNPNALQFKHAIRALLLRNNVEAPNTANCITALNDLPEGTNDVIDDTTFNDKSQTIDPAVHALLNTSTNWRFDALYYISGYIAKKMVATMKCPECAVALYQPSARMDQVFKMKSTLLSFKAYGNLFVPSLSTFEVVKVTDKLARELLLHWQDVSRSSVEKVVVSVIQIVKNRVFLSLEDHSMQSHLLGEMKEDHITTLVKHISRYYLKIFICQFGKVHTERIVKANRVSKRQKLLKNVLFYHD
eukprot:gene13869-4817_t